MATTAPRPRPFDPVPQGSHVARLYRVIHIGTTEFEFKGETKKSNKVMLTFELCNEKKVFNEGEEPQPLSISREFGFSMSPKGKLRPFIEGMFGMKMHDDEAYNFDFETLPGQECLLTVGHEERSGNTYANILNASPLPKGMQAPGLVNKPEFISVDSTPEHQIETLPEWITKKIYATEEWTARQRHVRNMQDAGLTGQAGTNIRDYRPDVVQEEKDIPF
jgi:hypothetical protein